MFKFGDIITTEYRTTTRDFEWGKSNRIASAIDGTLKRVIKVGAHKTNMLLALSEDGHTYWYPTDCCTVVSPSAPQWATPYPGEDTGDRKQRMREMLKRDRAPDRIYDIKASRLFTEVQCTPNTMSPQDAIKRDKALAEQMNSNITEYYLDRKHTIYNTPARITPERLSANAPNTDHLEREAKQVQTQQDALIAMRRSIKDLLKR